MQKIRVVQLTIDAANAMAEPDPCRCHPGDKVIFVVTNDDATAHWVSIAGADIKLKEDNSAANPLVAGQHLKKVDPGETDFIKGHQVLPAGSFGKTKALQFTTYKYTVVWADNQALTTNMNRLDPDLDVTP